VFVRDTYPRDRAGTLGAMFNKVGAAYMFAMAGGCLFLTLGFIGSEGGAWGTAISPLFRFGFVGLGIWLLRQR
jgi:hypothetical protein